jgi:hypothetical protein
MRQKFISEEEVDKALEWLRDNAHAMGAAKERVVKAGHMIKHIKALEMKKHEGAVSKAEMLAMASDTYKEAILEDAMAHAEFEKMKSLREAAALKIEAWRSQEANYRSMRV